MIQAFGGRHFIAFMSVVLLTAILQYTGHLPDSGAVFEGVMTGIGLVYFGGGALHTAATRLGNAPPEKDDA